MAREALQAAIGELFAAPLEEFVSERTRLARELRSNGNRPVAAELAKLPKPSPAAWALNRVSREEPDAVGEWYAAAAALRDVSQHPGEVGGDVVRAAIGAHRAATERLLAEVREHAHPNGRPLSEAMLDRVRKLVQQASATPELADRVRGGFVMEDKAPSEALPSPARPATAPAASAREGPRKPTAHGEQPPDHGPKPTSPGLKGPTRAVPGAGRESKREAQAAARRRKREAEAAARAARRAEIERQVARSESEVEQLHQVVSSRSDAVQAADARLEEARRVLHRCESEAAAAHDALDEAEAAQGGAQQELKTLRTRLKRLEDSASAR